MKFIQITTKNYLVFHGYDQNNQEIIEEVQSPATAKIIALDRIQSVTEKYVLTLSAHGRVIYWEYEEDFNAVRGVLAESGLLLEATVSQADRPAARI